MYLVNVLSVILGIVICSIVHCVRGRSTVNVTLLRFEGRDTEISDRCGRFLAFVGLGACGSQKIRPWRSTICWVLMRSLMTQSAMEPGSSVLVRFRVIASLAFWLFSIGRQIFEF